MRPRHRLIAPAACFTVALACYLLSFQTGAGVLFVSGFLLELTAWSTARRVRT